MFSNVTNTRNIVFPIRHVETVFLDYNANINNTLKFVRNVGKHGQETMFQQRFLVFPGLCAEALGNRTNLEIQYSLCLRSLFACTCLIRKIMFLMLKTWGDQKTYENRASATKIFLNLLGNIFASWEENFGSAIIFPKWRNIDREHKISTTIFCS